MEQPLHFLASFVSRKSIVVAQPPWWLLVASHTRAEAPISSRSLVLFIPPLPAHPCVRRLKDKMIRDIMSYLSQPRPIKTE